MNIFLDANVLVSVLNKEYPVFTYSSRVLSLSQSSRFHVYTSPVCMAIAFYFSEKKSGTIQAKKKMELLASHINIADVGQNDVLNALQNKKILDFEDGIEYYSALNSKCKYIITEDISDFHFSEIEILTSRKFIEKYFMN